MNKEYEKTVYTIYRLPFGNLWPKNMVSATPIRLFGKTIMIKYRMAKSNYKWSKVVLRG